MEMVWIILGIVLLGLLLLLAGATWFFFDYAVRRKPRNNGVVFPPDSPWGQVAYKVDAGKSWINTHQLETVQLRSFDGITLKAHILQTPIPTKKTVLMMHGFRGQDFNDFAVSVKYFYEAGYNVILADQRGHGDSGGKYLCFGVKERYDCCDWAKFAARRYGSDSALVLMGVSMGGATVLMSLGLDLPKNVQAVVADCGYTSPRAIFSHVCKNSYRLPPYPLVSLCSLLCRFLADFSIDGASTLQALKNNQIPVIFVHGSGDRFVPSFMTMENYHACTAPKELVIVEGAAHAMSFLKDTDKCWSAIRQFLEKHVG